ncbi:carboxylesterase family protein [Pirellulimonas nuda]|uniref:carboxylesterase family protein n=1 Tax=Pirellulimonas nuda TaxID=2528009 RepID=UPI0011A5CBC9|nr:peptidase [Pirellulimonas nuda]
MNLHQSIWLGVAAGLLIAYGSHAATIQLEDGRTLVGKIGETSGVAEDPTKPSAPAGGVKVTPILIVDDGLRRTFVPKAFVRDIIDQEAERQIKIRVWQNDAEHGMGLGRVGRMVRVTPFDQFGRRIYEMQGPGGVISVVQGITEITPVYTRVRGLSAEPTSYVWDQRIATSSIPRETLSMILQQTAEQGDLEARLQVVRLYLQGERYVDARRELEQVLIDFPEAEDLAADARQLRQLGARSILKEIELRRDAGQYPLVRQLLETFPSDAVAGETLQQVREMLKALQERDALQKEVLDRLRQVVEGIAEPKVRAIGESVEKEIAAELNDISLPRMVAFLNLSDGDALSNEQKCALAISGWLLGANQATDNLPTALSLFHVREKVLAYLREPTPAVRDRLLVDIRDMEGASVARVAELLKLMAPPLPLPEEAQQAPGQFELFTPIGVGQGDVRYLVQLPPYYDPLRSYPTIVTLNGLGYLPEQQLDFWSGPLPKNEPDNDRGRMGQAMRHGYITIAVDWQKPHQFQYDFSAREHASVLAALRDAMRRVAIDTDRVFLTGHDMGGDAAWDIGLAHPDLWAGVIPFLARPEKFALWYGKNAEYVPWYFVQGELDGGKVAAGAREYDRYLRGRDDMTVVELLGRGHEPFSDEIQRLFDWMGRKKRRPPPEQFEVVSMRPWDSFYWWLEVQDLPEKSMVHPDNWPPERGVRAAPLRGRKYAGNKLGAVAPAGRVTVWLSPDIVDFDKPVEVEINRRRATSRAAGAEPDLAVLLEDARTRGDRKRPFWAKVEWP